MTINNSDFIEIFDSKTDWETKKTLINEENNIPVFFTKYNKHQQHGDWGCMLNLYSIDVEFVQD